MVLKLFNLSYFLTKIYPKNTQNHVKCQAVNSVASAGCSSMGTAAGDFSNKRSLCVSARNRIPVFLGIAWAGGRRSYLEIAK